MAAISDINTPARSVWPLTKTRSRLDPDAQPLASALLQYNQYCIRQRQHNIITGVRKRQPMQRYWRHFVVLNCFWNINFEILSGCFFKNLYCFFNLLKLSIRAIFLWENDKWSIAEATPSAVNSRNYVSSTASFLQLV